LIKSVFIVQQTQYVSNSVKIKIFANSGQIMYNAVVI